MNNWDYPTEQHNLDPYFDSGDMYETNPEWGYEPTGIFSESTVILDPEETLEDSQLANLIADAPLFLNWDEIAKAASADLPQMQWIYRSGLSRTFDNPAVREKFEDFLVTLLAQTERKLTEGD